MVGGYRLENSEQVPIRECVRINDYLETAQMDQLQMARFEIPLALVHDRFILALGGKKGKGKGQDKTETTKLCEAYDTVTNHWF